jgi:hypothetical protein
MGGDKPAHAQAIEVKREHAGRDLESVGDLACRHSLRPGLHQEPKDVETAILGERGERRDSIRLFHISTNIEYSSGSQGSFQRNMK